jgi:hypothetical protein
VGEIDIKRENGLTDSSKRKRNIQRQLDRFGCMGEKKRCIERMRRTEREEEKEELYLQSDHKIR